ncbi:hypothetical protein JST97_30805 [bacterium]|nr:hypothetical protein [bacterium]
MKRNVFFLLLALTGGVAADGMPIGPGSSPSLACDRQGRLWVAYEKAGDIWVRSSQDNGQSWGAEVAVCTTLAPSVQPSLGLDSSGAAEVLWLEDGQVAFSRSADGQSFAAPVTVAAGKCADPDLAVGPDDSVHAVWIDLSTKSPDVFYGYSNNAGKSWTRGVNVSRTPGICSHAVLSLGGDNLVNVAWLDTSSGVHRPDINVVQGSQDSFSPPRNASNTAGRSQWPEILATSSNRVYLAWMDNSRSSSVWDIYFARAQDNGQFTPPIFFDTPAASTDPTLACDDSNHVAVAWVDASQNAAAPDIFLAQSGDGGVTFTQPVNVSQTPGVSRAPSMVLNQNQYVVVWEESEGGQKLIKVGRQALTRKPRQPVSSGKY